MDRYKRATSDGVDEVSEVIVTSDVFRSCMYHAFLTEKEEIAGLLLGFKSTFYDMQSNTGDTKIYIYGSLTSQRRTKEKDRVEMHPE